MDSGDLTGGITHQRGPARRAAGLCSSRLPRFSTCVRHTDSCRWNWTHLPLFWSTQSRDAGKIHCHAHSRSASGYFRTRTPGLGIRLRSCSFSARNRLFTSRGASATVVSPTVRSGSHLAWSMRRASMGLGGCAPLFDSAATTGLSESPMLLFERRVKSTVRRCSSSEILSGVNSSVRVSVEREHLFWQAEHMKGIVA